jgi:hypothetical protein
MHLPPPAHWRLGRSKAHATALALLATLQVFSLLLLLGQMAPTAWWGLLALAFALLLHAVWSWWDSPSGQLRWTGRDWHWMQGQAVQACNLRCVLDGQTFVLLRAAGENGAGPRRWLWLERGEQSGPAWAALRRAIFASAIPREPETPYAQAAALGGATMPPASHSIRPQAPQTPGTSATAAVSTGANGLQDLKLR